MFLRKRRRIQASSFSLYWEKIFSALPERVGLGSITSPRGKWNEGACASPRIVELGCLHPAKDSRIEEFRSMQEIAVKKEKQKNIEKQENIEKTESRADRGQAEIKVPVNKIIPFSSVDGPGNRTAIFLQACNLDCKYCHNPETRALCIHCGDCIPGCPTKAIYWEEGRVAFSPEKCIGCDQCIHACTHNASPRIRRMSAKEVFQEASKNLPFIRGITVSGGECTLYPEFLRELGMLCKKRGIGFLLDSNGYYDFSKDEKDLLPYIDGVMLDIKAYNGEEHKRVTGFSNEEILKNMRILAEYDKLFEVRTVVVPGLFSGKDTVEKVSKELSPYVRKGQKIRYKIIAYREFGVREQYRQFESPGEEELKALKELAEQEGMQDILLI